ncbi:MAG: hypothetical protein MRY32_03315 [Rickettsiales bacterium]|nr:hypothetical protein [Rickettsiales bacterium]
MNDELIREVDDAMKLEQWQKLWQQYGSLITYVAIGFVAIASISIFIRGYQHGVAESETDTILKAHTYYLSTRYEEARDLLTEAIEDASGDRQAIMRIWLGKTHLKLSDSGAALAAWSELVDKQHMNNPMVRLACTHALMVSPDDERFSACYNSDPENPFTALTNEQQAIHYHMMDQDKQAEDVLPDTTRLSTSQKRRLTDLEAYLTSSVHAE